MNREKRYDTVAFIFRRDLRLTDNTALNHAASMAHTVIPCFIFDPKQTGVSNSYKSDNAYSFMLASLEDLAAALIKKGGALSCFIGDPALIVQKIIAKNKIEALLVNADYTPFSKQRDAQLAAVCRKNEIDFHSYDDCLLNAPHLVKTKKGGPFTIFGRFYVASLALPIALPQTVSAGFYTDLIAGASSLEQCIKKIPHQLNPLAIRGGSHQAALLLKKLPAQADYQRLKDYPTHSTTHLSAHLKFGTVSVRHVYHQIAAILGINHPLIRQLYWRDFFTTIVDHFPHVFRGPFRPLFDALSWDDDQKKFSAWCAGRTGFPIVDAGMRELNITGFMHNRIRLITASFLVKDLHINWQWGERYFAQKLVDYDPAVNNGNWQWVASTGCDATPYFRIFNPWIQQQKWDPQCVYIKKWIPELASVEPKILHRWFAQQETKENSYPLPLVDHQKESAIAKASYRKVYAKRD